ncbi:inorganic diphosphatase [Patescibacteria group bacterium]|nr:inorganic diphosphatase [Patescibacteria group bacterium]MBU2416936.1 inorganic diphosphatase [Patescibacteria group bacterium]MBU2461014.1 inorganic diphosphatase [Patescibacteria group bacterium]
MNLWHEVSAGENIPKEVNVIIEIPKGSKNKYEIDKETGLIALDRAMHTAQDYPFDYGFIPQSFWDDDDALDVILLTTYPLVHGILVRARPVGLMNMIDSGDNDDKIIAVPVDDPRWDKVKDISDVNHHTIKEMEHFFSTYKKIQNKEVSVTGFQDYKAAQEAIVRGLMLYKEKYGEK